MKRFLSYMNPYVKPDALREMDITGLKKIRIISLIALEFEAFAAIAFLFTLKGELDKDALVSIVSVSLAVLTCAAAALLSNRMLKKETFSHRGFAIFKLILYVVFSYSAIWFDYRNYIAGNQMVTFYVVNLVMICFIVFKPLNGTLLIASSYTCLFILIYCYDRAAHINLLNFFVLAMVSIASSSVLYHSLINVSSNTVQLSEDNVALENTSRRDGLTGLLNRLALENDAQQADGNAIAVYMIDVNFFKEINDRHGHVTGDALLKQTSKALQQMYPLGRHYRYGGDEFLVVTPEPFDLNYNEDTYTFTYEPNNIQVFLSISCAQGSPTNYHEFFALISRADKALYTVKKHTHSVQYGGHERRKS